MNPRIRAAVCAAAVAAAIGGCVTPATVSTPSGDASAVLLATHVRVQHHRVRTLIRSMDAHNCDRRAPCARTAGVAAGPGLAGYRRWVEGNVPALPSPGDTAGSAVD